LGFITIPNQKLEETVSFCKFYFFKRFITKNQLQVLSGHLIFLHKAVKPARVFVICILALLRKMGNATKVAIDEGTKWDLQWFMVCAHAVNGSVKIFKSVLPWIDIFVDASLTGLGGSLVITFMRFVHKPSYCIAHWEAINILLALRLFSPFLAFLQCHSEV
jgi:hypothetical protein